MNLPATIKAGVLAPFVEPYEPDAPVDNPNRDIRIGTGIVVFFFVVLLGWAALAPLDAAVPAQGVIAVSGNRQSVQHREGGVVNAINVREGQHVKAGEVLIEMAAPDLVAQERACGGRGPDEHQAAHDEDHHCRHPPPRSRGHAREDARSPAAAASGMSRVRLARSRGGREAATRRARPAQTAVGTGSARRITATSCSGKS